MEKPQISLLTPIQESRGNTTVHLTPVTAQPSGSVAYIPAQCSSLIPVMVSQQQGNRPYAVYLPTSSLRSNSLARPQPTSLAVRSMTFEDKMGQSPMNQFAAGRASEVSPLVFKRIRSDSASDSSPNKSRRTGQNFKVKTFIYMAIGGECHDFNRYRVTNLYVLFVGLFSKALWDSTGPPEEPPWQSALQSALAPCPPPGPRVCQHPSWFKGWPDTSPEPGDLPGQRRKGSDFWQWGRTDTGISSYWGINELLLCFCQPIMKNSSNILSSALPDFSSSRIPDPNLPAVPPQLQGS